MAACAWLVMAFFAACSDRKSVYVDKFPRNIELEGHAVEKMNHYPGVMSISAVGDGFLCRTRGEFFYYIFNADFDSLGTIARRGKGKDEFLAPYYSGQCEGGSAYVLDRPKGILFSLNLQGKGQKQLVKLPARHGVEPRFLFKVDDRSYIGSDDNHDNRMFVYRQDEDNVTIFEQPPFVDNKSDHQRDLYECLATYNRAKQRVAVSYFNLPVVSIWKADGTLVRAINVDKNYDVKNRGEELSFTCICSTDNCIYALYGGDRNLSGKGKQAVLVFDWDGNPVAKYTIAAASYFVVDNAEKHIIVINEDDARCIVSRYALPR